MRYNYIVSCELFEKNNKYKIGYSSKTKSELITRYKTYWADCNIHFYKKNN